ncbi:DPP IV N-terminal domain-containing protein [Streptosporangium sp. NPDC049644]|uniref:S9 family peptidase n=1 Tax=Streptosporangium sp. NPDC049644 TaxID=3155507 RepID=UPI003425C94D
MTASSTGGHTPDREQRYQDLLAFADHVHGGEVDPVWIGDHVGFTEGGVHHLVDCGDGSRTTVRELGPGDVVTGKRVRRAYKIGRPDVFEAPSPCGRFFAGETGPNLSVRWAADDRGEPLTADGVDGHRWDVRGAAWSPDGLRLLARKVDTTGMDRLHVMHWLKPNSEVEVIPTGNVAGRLEDVSLHVVHRVSRQVVRIDSGPEIEQDLRPLGWSTDGRELYYLKTNRYRNPFVLMAADPETGASRVVHEERSSTWVSFWEKGMSCHLLPSRSGFLWLAERDGWAHLYRHDMTGRQVTRLTEGEWPVTGVAGIDEAGGWVYFTAHVDSKRPYDTHLCRVRLDGTDLQRLTDEPGTHRVRLSPAMDAFVDTHSSVDRPPASDLRRADGSLVCRLSRARVELPAGVTWRAPEEFTVLAADGETELHGQLYLPSDFDPARSYPIIDSIYAGPNSAYVPTHLLDANGIQSRALAELGFAVVMVDGRGTPERSKAFHDVVYRNFGRHEIPDHAAVIRQLAASRPYLDASRVGVYGRSFGGFFTTRALLTAPDVFHVGVSINGNFELREGSPGPVECVMGPLADNLDGYDFGSNLALADRLEGKLLLIHGTSDINVPFSAAMKAAEAFTRAGKPFDFLPVNEQPHHFSGLHRTYLSMALARYFCEHLGVDAL